MPLIRLTDPIQLQDIEEEDLATLFAYRESINTIPLSPYYISEDKGAVDLEETKRNDNNKGDLDKERIDLDPIQRLEEEEEGEKKKEEEKKDKIESLSIITNNFNIKS